MATSREYLDFVMDNLSLLDNISYKQMMGEYIIYYRGKIAAYVCDDRLLVKVVPSSIKMFPDAKREAPYEGAKEMLLIENVEGKEFLKELFDAMYDELPMPRKKK
ncbi:MAG: TfoX/Sxy family protein [Clostridia bacterium]|nr:TfoX/Sxy family protein [Clostridia bacterium]